MKTDNLIKSFKKYLKETPKEQLDKDFEEIENKLGYIGVGVEEYLESIKK